MKSVLMRTKDAGKDIRPSSLYLRSSFSSLISLPTIRTFFSPSSRYTSLRIQREILGLPLATPAPLLLAIQSESWEKFIFIANEGTNELRDVVRRLQ